MSPPITYSSQPWLDSYSDVIDVRSPSEYAEDHWPGSVNLPVLNDQERAQVGTLYTQVDPFEGRKVGASLVTANISHHLQTYFIDLPKSYHPLIYCWRGGQRSGSLAQVLHAIGWSVTVLTGGYKTYRAYVRDHLKTLPQQFRYHLLCGPTGSGKSLLLQVLAEQGEQVLDLEQLACHRGSLLGQDWQQPQPSQKAFESHVLSQLRLFNRERPVWLEAESAKIGRLHLPPALWQQMSQAFTWQLEVPLPVRIGHLIELYSHWMTYPDQLKAKLRHLTSRYGRTVVQEWEALIDSQEWNVLVEVLLRQHYDPTYHHSWQRAFRDPDETLALKDLRINTVQAVAQHLAQVTRPPSQLAHNSKDPVL